MNLRHRLWIRAGLAVGAVWGITYGVATMAEIRRPTAERVEAWAMAHPLGPGLAPEDRMGRVEDLAGRVIRLSFEERRAFRQEGPVRDLFMGMTPAERSRYVDLTLSTGMRQVMESFNRMEPKERKRLVDRALQDLDRAEREGHPAPGREQLDDETLGRFVDEGFRQYFIEASAETKLDLEPLILRLQALVQGRR